MKDKNKFTFKDFLQLFIFIVLVVCLCLLCKSLSTFKTHKVKADSLNYSYNSSNGSISIDTLILKTTNKLYAYNFNINGDFEIYPDIGDNEYCYIVGDIIYNNENYYCEGGCIKLTSDNYLYGDDTYFYVVDNTEGDKVACFNSSGCYLLSNFSSLNSSDIFYPYLQVSTLDNVISSYPSVYCRTIDISSIINNISALSQNYGFQLGYSEGYSDGLDYNDNTFNWLSVFNSFFTVDIFPNFKIYYLLVFSLGLVVFKTIARALFRG